MFPAVVHLALAPHSRPSAFVRTALRPTSSQKTESPASLPTSAHQELSAISPMADAEPKTTADNVRLAPSARPVRRVYRALRPSLKFPMRRRWPARPAQWGRRPQTIAPLASVRLDSTILHSFPPSRVSRWTSFVCRQQRTPALQRHRADRVHTAWTARRNSPSCLQSSNS